LETTRNQLTEQARENLQRNAELREKDDSRFLTIQPNQKIVSQFDPEKIEPIESEFDGKKVRRFQYWVTDPNSGLEKIWPVSKRTSEQIDAFLIEGHTLLKIQRIGSGKDTRYHIMPA
jgi:hypothetical protein